jgi:hypothetical protein
LVVVVVSNLAVIRPSGAAEADAASASATKRVDAILVTAVLTPADLDRFRPSFGTVAVGPRS